MHLKQGYISDIDYTTGMVKVNLDGEEQDFETDWLSVLVKNTLHDKEHFPYESEEHVACLFFDENCEQGIVIGATYSSVDKPPSTAGKGKRGFSFDNGDYLLYDKENKAFTGKFGNTEITLNDTIVMLKNNNSTISLENNKIDIKQGSNAEVLLDNSKTFVKYGTSEGTFDNNMISLKKSTAEVTIKASGLTIKRGSDSVKTILQQLITLDAAHVHGLPGTPPSTAANYTALLTNLTALFEA